MKNIDLPFNKDFIDNAVKEHNTPFHIYDEKSIIENLNRFKNAFDWVLDFKNYYAVKACPNPHILDILKNEGCGMDCSSMGELVLSEKIGLSGENIMFTSNDTPVSEFKKAQEIGAIINFDDISHIRFFVDNLGEVPQTACCRYNPGPLKGGNSIIGKPEEAKYGMTKEQILGAYIILKNLGVKKFGLHTMVASNELDPMYFVDTAKMLFDLLLEIEKKVGITIDFINLGGGIGIPYKPDDTTVDYDIVSQGIKKLYDERFKDRETPIKIVTEMGRMITGPYGYLVSKVIHLKDTYKKYVGLDASMSNLMRPGMYGAYHHITVLGKEDETELDTFDVTGSLCENNDKFAIDRLLPADIKPGDIIAIHDAGAHGYAMGFNYNAKLKSKELLMKPNGTLQLIRRAETLDDYFATLDFEGSEYRNLCKITFRKK